MANLRERLIAQYQDFITSQERNRLAQEEANKTFQMEELKKAAERILDVQFESITVEDGYPLGTIEGIVMRERSYALQMRLTCPKCGKHLWSNEFKSAVAAGRVFSDHEVPYHDCLSENNSVPNPTPPPEPQTWQEKLAEAIVEAIQEATNAD